MGQCVAHRLGIAFCITVAIAACASPDPTTESPTSPERDERVSRSSSSPSPSPTQSPTPKTSPSSSQPSPSPTPKESPSPTPTPSPDSATSDRATSDSATVVQDWPTIQGNGVQLKVPSFYVGGNPAVEYDQLVAQLKAIDPKYAQRLEAIADNPEVSALLAFDNQDRRSAFLTNVNITSEAIPPDLSLEDYMDKASGLLAQSYQIQSQSVVPVGPYRAGQMVGEIEDNDVRFKQLFYMIPHEGRVWVVTYSTGAKAFEERLKEFTQSIQTIQLESLAPSDNP